MKKLLVNFLLLLIMSDLFAQTYKYDNNHQIIEIRYDNGTRVIYQYDANGNRIKMTFIASDICPGGIASFYTDQAGISYQWQVDQGSGFSNVVNGSVYSGATTNSLLLTNPPTSWYGYKYRCLIDGSSFSNQDSLRFVSTWYGGKDTAWENPANWGCNQVPDGNTDVVINGNSLYFPVVGSIVLVRSLSANKSAEVKVLNGFQLKVLH